MGQKAYVVLLSYDGDQVDDQLTIEDMEDALTAAGFTVVNINPWGNDGAPTLNPSTLTAVQPVLGKLTMDPQTLL